MHIPLWLYLASIFLAFSIQDMAGFLRASVRNLGSTRLGGGDIRSSFPIPFKSLFNPSKITTTTSNIHTTTATMSATKAFMDAVRVRRSIYPLSKDIPIPVSRVQELIKETLLHVPSSFNSQTTRVLLLVGAEHEKLWELTKAILKPIVPEDAWGATEGKMNMFKAAAGTVCPLPFLSILLNMKLILTV
jgi:hypothetical protein